MKSRSLTLAVIVTTGERLEQNRLLGQVSRIATWYAPRSFTFTSKLLPVTGIVVVPNVQVVVIVPPVDVEGVAVNVVV